MLGNGVDPTGNGGALPGYGDQRGYELLREAGLNTEQAVQVVSWNGAECWRADKVGSVAEGKNADLVLLERRPRGGSMVIRNVMTAYKNGVGYDPAKLVDAVRGRVGVN